MSYRKLTGIWGHSRKSLLVKSGCLVALHLESKFKFAVPVAVPTTQPFHENIFKYFYIRDCGMGRCYLVVHNGLYCFNCDPSSVTKPCWGAASPAERLLLMHSAVACISQGL